MERLYRTLFIQRLLTKYPLESEIAELIRSLLFPFNHANLIQDSG